MVAPRALVALGATAAKAIFGSSVRVTRDRGRLLDIPFAQIGAVTIHPSAILRAGDRDERHEALTEMVDDLAVVADALRRSQGGLART